LRLEINQVLSLSGFAAFLSGKNKFTDGLTHSNKDTQKYTVNKTEYVSLRLTAEKSKQLDRACAETGEKKSAIARMALDEYLDKLTKTKTDRIGELKKTVDGINAKIDAVLEKNKRWWKT
jgi:predicted DNA-binding protein